MPTIMITSNEVTAVIRRRTAMSLTAWLGGHGSNPRHTIITFTAAEPMGYFAGGLPPTGLGPPPAGPQQEFLWAHVVAVIRGDRTDDYVRELAGQVHRTLAGDGGLRHFVFRASRVDPALTYFAERGDLLNAAALAGTPAPGAAEPRKG